MAGRRKGVKFIWRKICDRGFGALVVIRGSLVLERRGGTTQRGTAATVSGDPTFERCGAAS